MVLWEITLGTAYFLGLKRTYKLALKLQRKLISPKHPKIRQFVHRRTRYVFDVALRVHHKVQERDIEVGRNLGNWILRWLDKMKPEAQIRGPSPPGISACTKLTKQSNYSSHVNKNINSNQGGLLKRESSDRHLFTVTRSVWPKSFPTISIMMKSSGPVGQNTQYRRYGTCGSEFFTVDHGKFGFGQVLRNDIRDWVSHR
ncbi:hypothetical protein PHJA_001795000 [Phtheirospermum japonicum]|uniref:Uncharacterized protein n=1 Tax=Phtheirospermum japonicum TaxID=374723 RepID=A0A830CBC6_9LAMI|nr:hypothetical protein PHJA_001795000 [Phtheirospermum japonicum]